MNIEELARQAGVDLETHMPISRGPIWIATQQELERFAGLVLERAAQGLLALQFNGLYEVEGEYLTGEELAFRRSVEFLRAMKPTREG